MNAIFLTRANQNGEIDRLVATRRIKPRVWRASLLAIGIWTATLAALISLYVQPTTRIHDEFSYMLAADTLLHGRLANPTPPAWEALQSFHTVMQPNYASKYPVGAGLLVAIGWILVGTPLASSWLAAGLLAASNTWMLAGALPKRWAILGGILVSLSPFIQLAWSQSLLHGFLPASGSGLLMGGILRLRRRVEFSSALASGFGIGLLAISRPFEGLCCTVIGAALLWIAWSRHAFWVRSKMTIQASVFAAAPIITSLILIVAHNLAVTGNWCHMPYQLHEKQYGVAPLFVFGSPNLENTAKRNDLPAVFNEFHAGDSLNWYRERVGLNGWLRGVSDASRELFKLTFPFIGVFLLSGTRWTRYRLLRGLFLAVAVQVAASGCVCWVYSHYLAPVLPWLLLLALLALRMSSQGRSTSHARLVRISVLGILLIQLACIGSFVGIARNNEAENWSRNRQAIVDRLSSVEGKHLVLVRYSAKHNVHHEWVYNLAEPSEAKIVWARFEDGRWIRSLRSGYPDRSVWVIDADDPKTTLKKFAEGLEKNSSDTGGH